ncbi:hypothetical protein Nepgr_011206 [Nepenthes gracilis]|uniref:Uncharacterized protein n=1 Tax=Nepenthes gracilis TaxID=150966 RepID=A0AAD3SDN1_NEPGR|nr:hypothetical protein Nepgr_011206 [Nepenthes gracilis]
MDAVELAIPAAAAVAVPKLMESEGFGGDRVTVSDAKTCESDGVSVSVSDKMEKWSSLFAHRDLPGPVNVSDSPSCVKKMDAESCRNSTQFRLLKDGMPPELNHGGMSSPVLLIEEKQLQQKTGKTPRSGNGCFKRPRMPQLENLMPQAEVNDTEVGSDKFGSLVVKCSNAAKTKNNSNSKRGDRRNSKVTSKAKCDSFSLKAGFASFNPAPGGNNPFGMFGLKPEVHDITKLMADISLNELLEGSYDFPTFGKVKGKIASDMNENIMHSVRKAFSILRVQGSVQGKQSDEVDIGLNKKAPLLPTTSSSCMANDINGEEENHHESELSSSVKVQQSCIKTDAPAASIDLPLYQPRDILDRLLLPPPKDLESLLQDAAKPVASSRCSDPRSGKTISHRMGFPPFPWSHNYNGLSKSNSEAAKSSRSTCHGRWVKIGKSCSFFGAGTDCFNDLGSLAYDHSLVPSSQLKYGLPEMGNASTFVSLPGCEQASSSGKCATVSQSPPALNSPRLLAAAQTLCDIANCCLKHDPNGLIKWPKKPAQKAMKARKFKSSDKPEGLSMPKSGMMLEDVVRIVDPVAYSKRPKLSMTEKKEDFGHVIALRGPNYWSAPRSSRSSPIRSLRDSFPETKHCNGNFAKQPFMIPPPPRVLDKPNHAHQKLRKVVPMDLNRGKR